MTELFEERLERTGSEAQALTDAIAASAHDHSRNTKVDLEELAVVAGEQGLGEVFEKGLIKTIASLKIDSRTGINKTIGQGE